MRELLSISFPMIVSQGAFAVMIFTDRYFMSMISPTHLAASLGGGVASFFCLSLFVGVLSYSNALVAQAYLDAGVQFVIIGTKAVSAPHFVNDLCAEFPGHIIVGLDAKDGKVAIDGWSKLSHHSVIDMAQRFEADGVEAIVFTDIGRDGMMSGVNLDSTVELAQSIHIPVVASGGITNIDDIRAVCEVTDEGIIGAITGRAIYEGSLDLAEAQKLADELCGDGAAG